MNANLSVSHGYTPIANSFQKPYVVATLQKCIEDQYGNKKYFINIDLFSHYTHREELRFSAEVQFYNRNNEVSFNCTFMETNNKTIEEVEYFFENVWKNMCCGYYDYASWRESIV